MKIVSFISTFEPHTYGGGEVSALNLARWLSQRGHNVSIITMAGPKDCEISGDFVNGVYVWRKRFPRPYAYWENIGASISKKFVYYIHDHLHYRNKKIVGQILDNTKPDFALIHVISGIGFNSISEISKRDIPTIYVMHDLNLVCARGSLFKRGAECLSQCKICKIICGIRFSYVSNIPRLSFCSPSQANLNKAGEFLDLKRFRLRQILDVNKYPTPTVKKQASDLVRFLFVGRLSLTKGVHVVAEALKKLENLHKFEFVIVGVGAEESELKRKYAHMKWCIFKGFLSHQEISNLMAESDVLCVPSIWQENSPGVVIHALGIGLPVLGSNKGGIPELVTDNETGLLLPPGNVEAWRKAFEDLLNDKSLVLKWQQNILSIHSKFDQDCIGQKMLELINDTVKN
jgi:glycosyltransferase involved in cell wall biosynthesis